MRVGQAACATTAVLGAAGCPIPVPLEVEADALNSWPAIESASGGGGEFAFPGPMVLARSDTRSITLILRDSDVTDQLFVRLYVDYTATQPTPPLQTCAVQQSETLTRTADCPTALLCSQIAADDTSLHLLEAMVADRPFLEQGGSPAFRVLPPDAGKAIRGWQFSCLEPET